MRLRIGCEDIEDQLRTVNHFRANSLLQVAGLSGSQIVIEEHYVGFEVLYQHCQLFDFAPSKVRRLIGMFSFLIKSAADAYASGFG
jgi:hypothetical protein